MDRRDFLTMSASSILGLCLMDMIGAENLMAKGRKGKYNVVILGDTHFDASPDSIYHEGYSEPANPSREARHRKEFGRNAEMWRDRMPRLVRRAGALVDDETKAVFHMGDLIQGDCGSGEFQKKMLADALARITAPFGGLPFVTVVGNHDIRGCAESESAYIEYMMPEMSRQLHRDVQKTTFSFWIGEDAYIVIDFNRPDDDEIGKLLDETKEARHTFLIVHGPVFPYDGSYKRWFLHGRDKDPKARLHFREEFAKRGAIVLCGHTHKTELLDWEGDGGRITQMTMNSVWSKPELDQYTVWSEGADQYGTKFKTSREDGIFDEYRPGIREYSASPAAGSYKLCVEKNRVYVDFYAGDSPIVTKRFVLR